MLKLIDNNELRNFSIFFVWLINISGFFGILSDQKEFFLSSSPYVLTMTLFLLIVNNSLEKKFLLRLFYIFLLGLTVEIVGVNFSFFLVNTNMERILVLRFLMYPL